MSAFNLPIFLRRGNYLEPGFPQTAVANFYSFDFFLGRGLIVCSSLVVGDKASRSGRGVDGPEIGDLGPGGVSGFDPSLST